MLEGQTASPKARWNLYYEFQSKIYSLMQTKIKQNRCDIAMIVPYTQWDINWKIATPADISTWHSVKCQMLQVMSSELLVQTLVFNANSQSLATTSISGQAARIQCRVYSAGNELVNRRLVRQRYVTWFSLGRQVGSVDFEGSFFAMRVQRRTYVFHHPDTHTHHTATMHCSTYKTSTI